MSLGTRVFHILMTGTLAIPLMSCGGKEKAASTQINIIPSKPIVFSAPTIDDNGVDVAGPWFDFRIGFVNKTDEPVTLTAVSLKLYGQDSTGNPTVQEPEFTAAGMSFTLPDGTECKFSSFGTWQPGESKILELNNGKTACYRRARFLVSNTPKGTSGRNYHYRVRIKPMGWFGTEDVATDRFEKLDTFFTQ